MSNGTKIAHRSEHLRSGSYHKRVTLKTSSSCAGVSYEYHEDLTPLTRHPLERGGGGGGGVEGVERETFSATFPPSSSRITFVCERGGKISWWKDEILSHNILPSVFLRFSLSDTTSTSWCRRLGTRGSGAGRRGTARTRDGVVVTGLLTFTYVYRSFCHKY